MDAAENNHTTQRGLPMYAGSPLRYTHEEPNCVLILRMEPLLSSPLVTTLLPIGKELLQQNESYQAIITVLGLDPLQDLTVLTASLRGGDFGTLSLAAMGNFDGPKVAQVISMLVEKTKKAGSLTFSFAGQEGAVIASSYDLEALATGTGVRVGTRADMALASLDQALPLVGVMLDPASFKTKGNELAEPLKGVDRISMELSLASGISLQVGLHGVMSEDIAWQWLQLSNLFEKKQELRAELSAVTAEIENAEGLLAHLFEGVTIERFGSAVWLRVSWNNEIVMESLSNGLFKAIIAFFRKPGE
jgi:hypothetical protein